MGSMIISVIAVMIVTLIVNYVNIRENIKLRILNKELKLQRTYFKELFENSHDAIAALDNENRIISVNKAFEHLFQYKKKEIKGMSIDEVIASNETNDAYEFSAIVTIGGTAAADTKRRRKDGVFLDVSLLAFPVLLENDQIGIYAVYKDISEKKQVKRDLEIQKTYFKQLFENSPEAICILDNDDKFIDVNQAFESFFGYSREELIGRYINDCIVQEGSLEEATNITNLIKKGNTIEHETFRMRKDKKLVEVYLLAYPVVVKEKKLGVIVIYKDIAEKKKYERELIYMSTHDGLSGLYNRLYFEKLITEYDIEKYSDIGIIVCDVDGLKLLNDNLGHIAGDRLIVEAANIIKSTSKKFNGVAARIGGDEFAIIIKSCQQEVLYKVNRHLQEAVNDFNIKNRGIYLGISTGGAFRGNNFIPMIELIKKADKNMYSCKLCKKEYNKEMIMCTIMKDVI